MLTTLQSLSQHPIATKNNATQSMPYLVAGEGNVHQEVISIRAKSMVYAFAIIASIIFPPFGLYLFISASLAEQDLSTYLLNMAFDDTIYESSEYEYF